MEPLDIDEVVKLTTEMVVTVDVRVGLVEVVVD